MMQLVKVVNSLQNSSGSRESTVDSRLFEKIASSLLLLLFLQLVVVFSLKSQESVKKDTTIILLNDLGVQLECTQALNDLYNFKFTEAEKQFQYLRKKYIWH